MRTIALLAITGLIAAAETPKPTPVLSTAERIALGTVVAKSKDLADQQKQLSDQFAAIKREACQAHYKQDSCEITDKGEIVKIEAKPESKN